MASPLSPATRRQEAYQQAVVYLEDLWARNPDLRRLPRPITAIAEELGLKYTGRGIPEVVSGCSGMLLDEEIMASRADSPHRVRFTIAHEAAHALLHTHRTVAFRDGEGVDFAQDWLAEAEADACAAGLLLDHDTLRTLLSGMMLPLRPLPPAAWADEEVRRRVVSSIVAVANLSYSAVLQSMAEAGLVVGVTPWENRPGAAYSLYRQEWDRLTRTR